MVLRKKTSCQKTRRTEKGHIHHVYFENSLLPPANKVWAKVIFSQVCVIPSVHGGGVCLQGVSIKGDLHLWGSASRGSAYMGGLHGGRSASRGGSASRGELDRPLPFRCYGILSTSGRYASCWNAFLYSKYSNLVFGDS